MITFTITEKAEAKYEAFHASHVNPKTKKQCDLRPGTVGDLFQWHFTPTGIGDFCRVSCACGAQANIEDGEDF